LRAPYWWTYICICLIAQGVQIWKWCLIENKRERNSINWIRSMNLFLLSFFFTCLWIQWSIELMPLWHMCIVIKIQVVYYVYVDGVWWETTDKVDKQISACVSSSTFHLTFHEYVQECEKKKIKNRNSLLFLCM